MEVKGILLGKKWRFEVHTSDVTNIPVSKCPTSAGELRKKKSRVRAFEQRWFFASAIRICIILWISSQKLFSYDICLINGV